MVTRNPYTAFILDGYKGLRLLGIAESYLAVRTYLRRPLLRRFQSYLEALRCGSQFLCQWRKAKANLMCLELVG
jgi:hypothetical protein